MAEWKRAAPADVGMDEAKLNQARAYALSAGGSGIITRGGVAVMTWGDQKRRYDLKSTTKSIGVTALGLALGDGKTIHLVFSGNDAFSVRGATLRVALPPKP